MTGGQRILKNVASILGSEALVKLVSFLVTLYIARRLGTEALGKLSFALSFVAIFAVLADLGISRLTTRDLARDRASLLRFVPGAFALKALLALGTVVLLAAGSFLLGKEPETHVYVLVLLAWLLFDTLNLFFRAVFTALEEMEYAGLLKAFEKLLFFLLFGAVLLMPLEGRRLLGIVILYPLASLATTLLGVRLLGLKNVRLGLAPDPETWRFLLARSWPFAGSLILASVYLYADTIMLSYMKGDAVTGLYNAAYKLFITLYSLQAMLAEVFFPTFSRLFAEDRQAFRVFGRRVARVLFGLTVPLATGAIVLAPAGVDLIYGGEYAGAVTSFRILALDLVVRSGLTLAGAVLLVSDREQRFMGAIGMGALLNLVLNFLLIPPHGLDGAAVATVASEALVLLAMGLWALRIEALPWLQAFLLPLLASAGMALILRFVPADNLAAAVAAGIASYAALLVLIGGLRRQDVDFLRRSVLRRGEGTRS